MKTFQATSRYDRKKVKEVRSYRSITLEEAKNLKCGAHIQVLDRNGQVANAKVNGAVKRWKRDLDRIEIPCKYGLYEYFTLTNRDFDTIVVAID
jgi:hypothetical protein